MKARRFERATAFAAIALVMVMAATVEAKAAPPSASKRAEKADHGVFVVADAMIPMRDGVRLAADIYRPAREGRPVSDRLPTLLMRTPYNKGNGDNAEAKWFAARGYVVVINDVRGRYHSEGIWRMMADDPADGYDVVEWIAKQRWSNGKVGTYGTSYAGGTQHALAEMNPPHLTTMIPTDALSNCGVAGMRHGGAFELRFMNWIFQTGAPNAKAALETPLLQVALTESGRRIREHADNLPIRPGTTPLKHVPEYEAWLVEAMRSGPESSFWKIKGMSVVDHAKEYADVPALHITGWYDSWARQVSMNYEALAPLKKAPQRLLIGPWTHGAQGSNVSGEIEFAEDAKLDWNSVRLRWFDARMRDESHSYTEAEDPPVRIFVMGTGDDHKLPSGRLNRGGYWREEQEWPIKRTVHQPYYLHGDGTLNPAKPAIETDSITYAFDPNHPVPTIGGNLSSDQGLMTHGGFDQRSRDETHAAVNRLPLSERRDVLVFRSAPLSEDLEVTGTVVVKLWISSTAKDTDFTAKLIDEIPPNASYPIGFDLNIGDSILRTRYRESLDRPNFMEPGEVYPIEIRLYPTSNVFKRGHRIRVDISSSNYPRFDINPNTGDPLGTHRRMITADNTVWLDASRPSNVLLPTIPAASASR